MPIPTTLLHHEHHIRPADRHGRRRRLGTCVATLALVLALSGGGTALAGTASVTIIDATGTTDPAAGIPRLVKVTGNAGPDASVHVDVSYRPAGGAPCAPSATTDPGTSVFGDNTVSAAFEVRETHTFPAAGAYQFCIWLSPEYGSITKPITQEVTLRRPTGSISAAVVPAIPRPGQPFTFTIAGASEAPRSVYASIRAAGTECAPTYGSDNGDGLLSDETVNGAFSLRTVTSRPAAGAYIVCLWLAESTADTAPIAATSVPLFIRPGPPPPACVVPRLRAHHPLTLRAVRSRLRKAHCRAGKISRKRSANVRKGKVIRLAARPGAKLSNGASVRVVVSSGRR